jgi:hypothetical protein
MDEASVSVDYARDYLLDLLGSKDVPTIKTTLYKKKS